MAIIRPVGAGRGCFHQPRKFCPVLVCRHKGCSIVGGWGALQGVALVDRMDCPPAAVEEVMLTPRLPLQPCYFLPGLLQEPLLGLHSATSLLRSDALTPCDHSDPSKADRTLCLKPKVPQPPQDETYPERGRRGSAGPAVSFPHGFTLCPSSDSPTPAAHQVTRARQATCHALSHLSTLARAVPSAESLLLTSWGCPRAQPSGPWSLAL